MAFEVRHLQKKFGDKQAVYDLSFELQEPGVYALLGQMEQVNLLPFV